VRTGSGVVTRAVLVRPGNVEWFVRSAFYHTYATYRTETSTTTESYPCDTGTCSRDSVETRTVSEDNRANDGTCSTGLALLARQDAGYILQYDFFGEGHCSLHCYREVAQPNGKLTTAPCESPAPSSTGRP